MNESCLRNLCPIWQDELGEKLPIEEAKVTANNLVELYRTVEQPFSGKQESLPILRAPMRHHLWQVH